MTDLATLSLAIDSRPAVTAAGDLDKLASSAAGAEKATAAMSAGATQSTVNMQRVVATTSQAVGAISGLSQAANNNARAVGLQANELRNLSYQINDVATMALTGASAFQIMATQGGQLLQIAQASGGGIRGLFTQASTAAEAAAARIGLVGGALGGIAVALATATIAAAQYNAQQKELERTTFGAGRASGASLQSLNDAAMAGASRGTISTSASRDVVASLNTSGRIDPKVYGDVSANMRDLAKLMGTDIPTATDTVTSALSGGVAGFDKLNAVLGLGGSAMREQIKDLNESGQAFEAQRIIVDAYGKRIQELNANKGFLERLNETFDFGRNTSNELSAIGAFFGGSSTPEQQLAGARKRVAGIEYNRDTGAGFDPQELAAANAEVTKLEATISSAATKGKDAKTALTSLTVQPLIESLNPAQKKIQDIQNAAQLMAKYLAEGGVDKDGSVRRTMDGLMTQARTLADELARGGSALADGLRRAQFEAGQVGRSGVGRTTADINFEFENRRRQIEGQNQEPAARDAALASLAQERAARLDATQREATITETQRSGLINRVPEDLRQYYIDAAAKTGVPLDYGLAVSYAESSFNPKARSSAPNSHAYGLMQLQPKTAAGEGVDPSDPAQNVLGGFQYLRKALDKANNDQALAYGLYHDGLGSNGSSEDARSTYARIQRFQNMPTTGQESAEQDQRNRALEEEQKKVAISTQLLGVNGEAYEAASRKAQLLADAQAKGIPITAELDAQFERLSKGGAAAARALVGTQAGRDLDFQRDQLGRDAYDQRAFADARSRFGDVTTPQATAYIEQSRENAILLDAKNGASSALTGFATDVLHGANAAKAASTALGRLADTLLSKVLDSVASSAFGAATKGGLSSLWPFASGGVMSSGGPLPLHAYATGGVANSPQMAIFGEGRMPEAFVPLPDGRRIPVAMQGGAANGNSAGAAMTDARSYSIDLRGSTLTEAQVRTALTQAIASNNAERDRTLAARSAVASRRFGQAA